MPATPFLISLRAPQRYVVAPAALVAAVAHIPVIGPHLEEAPYMGVLFIALTVACLILGCTVIVWDSRIVYLTAAVICGLAVLGYAATRLFAFPMVADDVGDWLHPLGVISVISESVVLAASVSALLGAGHKIPVASQDLRQPVDR